MRVISGKFGGRRLVSFKAGNIRPTTDRVKETIFNILRNSIESARVLDLFSGTGNLACECISRGAVHVVAVENHPKSLSIIRENLKLLDIEKEVKVVKDDVIRFLKRYESEPFDLILIDPPFTEKMADEVMVAVAESRVFGPSTVVVIESSGHETICESYGRLTRVDSRDFGDKITSFFEPRG